MFCPLLKAIVLFLCLLQFYRCGQTVLWEDFFGCCGCFLCKFRTVVPLCILPFPGTVVIDCDSALECELSIDRQAGSPDRNPCSIGCHSRKHFSNCDFSYKYRLFEIVVCCVGNDRLSVSRLAAWGLRIRLASSRRLCWRRSFSILQVFSKTESQCYGKTTRKYRGSKSTVSQKRKISSCKTFEREFCI